MSAYPSLTQVFYSHHLCNSEELNLEKHPKTEEMFLKCNFYKTVFYQMKD